MSMVKEKLKSGLLFLLSGFLFFSMVLAENQSKDRKKQKKRSTVSISSQLIDFKYEQEDLKSILMDFAEQRGMNLIFSETEAITSKVTFDAGKKITTAEAWEFLVMMLYQSGFSLVYRDDYSYLVMPNKIALKEAMPLYVNVDYRSLPDTVEKIRYVYFCNSIQLAKQQNELKPILQNIFSETDFADRCIFDTNSNMIIFTMSAELIKAAMQLIYILDETGFKETVEIMELQYARASEVVAILNNMIGASDQKKAGGFVSLSTLAPKARYFSEYASVIDIDPKGVRKINSLILMGKKADVNRIKDFINKHLDIPQQQGKTFYHVVELEWIKGADLVTTLQSLLQGPQGASGQSTGTILSDLAFDPQIKVVAEAISQVAPAANIAGTNNAGGSTLSNTVKRGGNRIVIASPERDWYRLESLIKQIDLPKKQVIVEMIIVDLDLQFIRRLATQLRTRGLCPAIFPKDMQAQAGLVMANIVRTSDGTASGAPLNSWVGDLSNILSGSIVDTGGGFNQSGTQNNGQIQWSENFNTPNPAFNSSTVFMVKQENTANAIWAFFQLLTTHKTAKVLTRPVIIASNNVAANVSSSVVKNLAGGVTGTVAPSVNYGMTSSPISVDFTPIISANNIVNLQLNICLNLWQNAADPQSTAQMNRQIVTNVSMKSGDVMILGGLIKEVVSRSKMSIPFFDKIPILGSFMANRFKNTTRDQLFILIRPTVVAPRMQGGLSKITRSASNFIIKEFEDYEDTFSNLRDPITRWFFNEDMKEGSVKVDSKISDFASHAVSSTTNTEKESLDIIKTFMNPTVDHNPLSVNWFSDSTHSKDRTPAEQEFSKELQKMVNPFQQSSM